MFTRLKSKLVPGHVSMKIQWNFILGRPNHPLNNKTKKNNKIKLGVTQQTLHMITIWLHHPLPTLFLVYIEKSKNHSFIEQLQWYKDNLVRMSPISSPDNHVISRALFPIWGPSDACHNVSETEIRKFEVVDEHLIRSLVGAHAKTPLEFCQPPLQLANQTQLQLVGVGVDFVFSRKEEEEEEEEEGRSHT